MVVPTIIISLGNCNHRYACLGYNYFIVNLQASSASFYLRKSNILPLKLSRANNYCLTGKRESQPTDSKYN